MINKKNNVIIMYIDYKIVFRHKTGTIWNKIDFLDTLLQVEKQTKSYLS